MIVVMVNNLEDIVERWTGNRDELFW